MELLTMLTERWMTIMLRAVMVLGPMVLVFWIIRPKFINRFRIHQPKQLAPITRSELPRTVMGLSIYLLPGIALYFLKTKFNYSPMYLDINECGLAYFVFTIFAFAVATDTWFYWTHRLMHSHSYLKSVHHVHHRSYNITPVSAYSFHIVEGLLNMIPYGILALVMPWHPLALLIFGIFGLFYNGYIHLGYDLPLGMRKKIPGANLFYSATHHSIHHQAFNKNFAVYFTFWDRLMGTEQEENQERSRV